MSLLFRQNRPILSRIGQELKRIRINQGAVMTDIAERLNVPHSIINKTEKAERRLDVGEFVLYCEVLNQDPAKVLKQVVRQYRIDKAKARLRLLQAHKDKD